MIDIIEETERFEIEMDGSVLELRRIPAEVRARISARNTTRVKTESGEWQDRTDPTGELLDCIDYAIVGWRGVRHPATKADVPPTSENKRRLPVRILQRVMTAVSEAESAVDRKSLDEIETLDRFLRVRADFPGLDCEECRSDTEDGAPDCSACPVDGLKADRQVMETIDIIDMQFFRQYPALVPELLRLILPPMTAERAAMFLVKLALAYQYVLAERINNHGH
uniref:Uncharacterized protein n=1 Tax=viral metagenome TaxID=1070528 RepID=A0A6M3K6R5_9ZZZZ